MSTKGSQSSSAILAQAVSPLGIRTPKTVSAATMAAEHFQKSPNHRRRIEAHHSSLTNELRKLAAFFPKDNPDRVTAKAFFGSIEATAELPETLAL